MRRLAVILAIVFLSTVSCATTSMKVPLSGNPGVATIGPTIGMSIDGLQKVLGEPDYSGECAITTVVRDIKVRLVGLSFRWVHEYQDIERGRYEQSVLTTCLLEDQTVSETREWYKVYGDIAARNHSELLNGALIKDIALRLLAPPDPEEEPEEDPLEGLDLSGPSFEI